MLITTTSEDIGEREKLMKIKRRVPKDDLERATKIPENYLEGNGDMCKVMDAIYAMARTIEERLLIKRRGKKKETRMTTIERIEESERLSQN